MLLITHLEREVGKRGEKRGIETYRKERMEGRKKKEGGRAREYARERQRG